MSMKIECIGCGCKEALIIFEERYHGERGSCPKCGANWPES